MRRVALPLAIGAVVLALGAAAFWSWNVRARPHDVGVELPRGFPEDGFSHASYEALLARHVQGGRIDYAGWHRSEDDRTSLDRYLAALAAFSPDNAPERFPDENDALAYWMYAYNAFVIKAVLDRWPLESVTDVQAPVEFVQGLGFFYTLHFTAGGRSFSLHELEHEKIIDHFGDPRAHFVLVCASASCPVVRPKLPKGEGLDAFLEQAAVDFVSDRRNVEVDHEAGEVVLSKIFEWYEDDFVGEVRRRGLPTQRGVLAYISLVAPERVQRELATASDYTLRFRAYDWSINAAEPPR